MPNAGMQDRRLLRAFSQRIDAPRATGMSFMDADKARHVGEAVAMVVAETLAQALDGAEAVEVDYEVLPHVVHAQDAMATGAPKVWEELPDNIPVETWFGDRAATDRAFAASDHV